LKWNILEGETIPVILFIVNSEEEDAMPEEPIVVVDYAGYRSEECPRAFILRGKRIEVRKLLGQWVEENALTNRRSRCFRVKGDDLGNHLLRYDEAAGNWLYAGETSDG